MNETRTCARLVVLDASRRVLLFLHADEGGREFWATPGGGVEAGETVEQAARREAAEELGARDVDLEPLWTGVSEFRFPDRDISQTETFFQVRRHGELLGPAVRDVHRRERISKVRWWSLDEIEESRDEIFPADLATRLREYFRRREEDRLR